MRKKNIKLILDLTIELKKDIQLIYKADDKLSFMSNYVISIEQNKKISLAPVRHYNYILKTLLNIYDRVSKIDSPKNEILVESLENLYVHFLKNHCIRISNADISNSTSQFKKISSDLCKKITVLFPNDVESES
jgi:hypothetical protein